MTRVLALDLGLVATGVATPAGDLDTIRTLARDGDARLLRIRDAIREVLIPLPHLVVIEDLPIGLRNAAAGALGMVHGVVRAELLYDSLRYRLVPPATLKTYATGRGNATKPDMRVELLQRTGLDVRDDNQCDAAWLRLLGLDLLGEPELDLPKTHRRALDKMRPPKGVIHDDG